MLIFNVFTRILTFLLIVEIQRIVSNSHFPVTSSVRAFAEISNDFSRNL